MRLSAIILRFRAVGVLSGALEKDPRFTDESSGDFSLTSSSPAIDAGDPDSSFDDVDGTRGDMGAYGGPSGGW